MKHFGILSVLFISMNLSFSSLATGYLVPNQEIEHQHQFNSSNFGAASSEFNLDMTAADNFNFSDIGKICTKAVCYTTSVIKNTYDRIFGKGRADNLIKQLTDKWLVSPAFKLVTNYLITHLVTQTLATYLGMQDGSIPGGTTIKAIAPLVINHIIKELKVKKLITQNLVGVVKKQVEHAVNYLLGVEPVLTVIPAPRNEATTIPGPEMNNAMND